MCQVYNTYNRHTVVTHPVGYHIDIFPSEKICLENKVCFRMHNCSSQFGRGGEGDECFVFALLDWEVDVRRRRDVYVAVTGRDERVTQPRWTQMLLDYDGQYNFDDL